MLVNQKKLLFLLLLFVLSSCQKPPQKMELGEYVIGDINTILIEQNYTQHYYAGMFMAVEEINANGGVNGIPLKVETRNDYANHREAYLKAGDLVEKKNAIVLTGTSYPQTTLGIARYAKEYKVPFLDTGTPSEDIIYSVHSSPYSFRIRSGYDLHLQALSQDIVDNESVKSLVIITYSNEEGQKLSNKFKSYIVQKRPDIKFSQDIYVAPHKTLFDNLALSIEQSYTTGIVILLDGPDIFNVMKDIQINRVAVGKSVFLMFGGEPEWVKSLLNLTPNDWRVTGLPWYNIKNKNNQIFFTSYQKKYNGVKPMHSSYVGYITAYLIADALRIAKPYKNDEFNRQKLAEALRLAKFESPLGLIEMRADNQSTLGTYIGTMKPYDLKDRQDKNNTIVGVRTFENKYIDPNDYLMPIKESTKLRNQVYKQSNKKSKPKIVPRSEKELQKGKYDHIFIY